MASVAKLTKPEVFYHLLIHQNYVIGMIATEIGMRIQ